MWSDRPAESAPVRPRLRPGVPAGGIAAVAVTLGVVVWSVLAGDGGTDGSGDGRSAGLEIRITAPEPPAAPRADRAGQADRAGRAEQQPMATPRVDARAITAAARRAGEEAAALAVAKAEAWDGPHADVAVLDRQQDRQTGMNRVTAAAVAPAGLRLADVYGRVTIRVRSGIERTEITMLDSRRRYDLDVRDGVLWITGPGPSDTPTELDITVPRGVPLLVNDLVGDLKVVGDLDAPARLTLRRGTLEVGGSLRSARVRVTETGTVTLGRVSDLLAVEVRGIAQVNAGQVERLAADLAGAATLQVATVGREAVLNLPGKADVRIGSVNGALRAVQSGAGSVAVATGRAGPFELASTGAGSFRFDGTAVDPVILLSGIGDVAIAAYDGTPAVSHDGPGRLDFGR
ncbi:hypothetical protein [Rhodospirillum centenum]|uniref:Uncharacterized protein n=1 Tax=Rhodospirillum centenum (strain ATCC 51521 / SW) TaxID=414684 RepID=B6IW08_RHOCS|nr:hypothetical protein [Rhodospirillum centenum]ACJ00482.1 hypothetical protein RC1_3117 [Rhodospirillum centenum SW]